MTTRAPPAAASSRPLQRFLNRRGQHNNNNNGSSGDDDNDPTKQIRKKEKVKDCYHCSKECRRYHDQRVAETVLPLVPIAEWESLHWSPDELPNTTGSKDIDNYFILRQIFLFLPFDLETLLAVSGTCRAWRILADRLPHWRYLLPMRNEVINLVQTLGWADKEYMKIQKYEREYSAFEEINKKKFPNSQNDWHYKLRFTEEYKAYANGNYLHSVRYPACTTKRRATSIRDRTHPDYSRPSHCPQVQCCKDSCCETSDCNMNCGKCSSCTCSSNMDHEEINQTFQDKKVNTFREKYNKSGDFLKHRTEQDKELARQAMLTPSDKKPIDWVPKLKRRKQRKQDRKKEQKELEIKTNNYGVLMLPQNQMGCKSHSEPCHEDHNNKKNNKNRNDDDDYDSDFADIEFSKNNKKEKENPKDFFFDDDDDDSDDGKVAPQPQDEITNTRIKYGLPQDAILLNPAVPLSIRSVSRMYQPCSQLHSFTHLNEGLELRDRYNLALRVDCNTLHENAAMIMVSTLYRQEYLFPSLSSFTSAVRGTITDYRKETKMHWFWDRHPKYCKIFFWLFLIMAICFAIAGSVGYNYDSTLFSIGTDQELTKSMSPIIASTMCILFLILSTVGAEMVPESWRSTQLKLFTLGSLAFILCILSVPLCLLAVRIRAADRLLDPNIIYGGEISVCDAWNFQEMNLTSVLATVSPPSSLGAIGRQCKLPSSLLPKSLAESAFLKFPEGTQILYHPPEVKSRIVPFTATRTTGLEATCSLATNSDLRAASNITSGQNDAGEAQSKTDVNRGNVGYYTIYFPYDGSVCSGESKSGIENTTVIILGDFSECPFWSSKSVSSVGFLHRRFINVLTPNSESQALSKATALNQQDFIDSVTNRSGTSSSFANTCGQANNLLATVSLNTPHDFYLRVASGFLPHWSASYYLPRLPYNPEDGGPYAIRSYWQDTLDYQLNGIVALQADSAIFINHKNSAAPIVPENLGDTEFSSAFKNSEKSGGNWQDEGMSPFWTAAHPAGIRRLRHDFLNGVIGILSFSFGLFFLIAICLFFSWGRTTLKLSAGVYVLVLCVATYFPLLIHASICFSFAAPNDSLELTNPVACLQASETDARGVFIFASVFGGLNGIVIILGIAFAACHESMEALCAKTDKCCEALADCLHKCCCGCKENCTDVCGGNCRKNFDSCVYDVCFEDEVCDCRPPGDMCLECCYLVKRRCCCCCKD